MTTLERLLRHDAWTTRSLLVLASGLPDAALDREFDMGHRSLRRTLIHIVRNMEVWCDLMNGQPQRTSAQPAASLIAISDLMSRLDTVSEQLLVLGRTVEEEQREEEPFLDYLDNPPDWKPLGAGLVHLATHGMHHRAQCLYLLKQLGVEDPPEGDALSWELAHQGLKGWPSAKS